MSHAETTKKKRVHVAVGVLLSTDNSVCIAKRPEGKHLAGYWEFPGGKVDAGETTEQALVREFQEELGVQVSDLEKFQDIHFDYPEKQVWLDVYLIRDHQGKAHGAEGQTVEWVPISRLGNYRFPEANTPIVERLQQEL